MGLHGFPRYTGDLDVLIAISESNARKVLEILADFGLSQSDFLEEEIVVEIGRPPLKIQILTGIDGVSFEECFEARIHLENGDLKIPFIGMDALLKNNTESIPFLPGDFLTRRFSALCRHAFADSSLSHFSPPVYLPTRPDHTPAQPGLSPACTAYLFSVIPPRKANSMKHLLLISLFIASSALHLSAGITYGLYSNQSVIDIPVTNDPYSGDNALVDGYYAEDSSCFGVYDQFFASEGLSSTTTVGTSTIKADWDVIPSADEYLSLKFDSLLSGSFKIDTLSFTWLGGAGTLDISTFSDGYYSFAASDSVSVFGSGTRNAITLTFDSMPYLNSLEAQFRYTPWSGYVVDTISAGFYGSIEITGSMDVTYLVDPGYVEPPVIPEPHTAGALGLAVIILMLRRRIRR